MSFRLATSCDAEFDGITILCGCKTFLLRELCKLGFLGFNWCVGEGLVVLDHFYATDKEFN